MKIERFKNINHNISSMENFYLNNIKSSILAGPNLGEIEIRELSILVNEHYSGMLMPNSDTYVVIGGKVIGYKSTNPQGDLFQEQTQNFVGYPGINDFVDDIQSKRNEVIVIPYSKTDDEEFFTIAGERLEWAIQTSSDKKVYKFNTHQKKEPQRGN
jgi:hypothetical protein